MSVWQVILDLAEIFPGESLVDTNDDGFAAAHEQRTTTTTTTTTLQDLPQQAAKHMGEAKRRAPRSVRALDLPAMTSTLDEAEELASRSVKPTS
jgi:hypothetical protein